MSSEELLHAASKAAANAYAPYSKARVGCALLSSSGRLYTGCNVENASYGLTICAERSAIFAAVASEGPSLRILQLAVIALGLEFPPCGACRQVIAEFAAPDVPIVFVQNKQAAVLSVEQLLPARFSF